MQNPREELGLPQCRAVGGGELEPSSSIVASSQIRSPRPGCARPAGSWGRGEAVGLRPLLGRGPRGVRGEPAASDSCSRAPRCLSSADVARCYGDGHEALGRTAGLGCQLSSHHLPWALGVQFRALTLVGEERLTFPSCSSCPPEKKGFCLLLSDCHVDACLLRSRHRIATEPAAFGSYHLGGKGVSSDNEQDPSEAPALQSVNKKHRLCAAKPSRWVREINKTTQILCSAPSLVFTQTGGSISVW